MMSCLSTPPSILKEANDKTCLPTDMPRRSSTLARSVSKDLERSARRMEVKDIAANDFKLNIFRHAGKAKAEATIDIIRA